MALLEELIADVPDPQLRAALSSETRLLKQRTQFGLVFERHLPETVLLAASTGVREGDEVRFRANAASPRRLHVVSIQGDVVSVVDGDGLTETADLQDLLVVKDFSDPVFPTLRPLGRVENADEQRSPHLVINGENFHVLQLLGHTYARSFDCILIDPPYNTGARDWRYNNDYVDGSDRWRHSKWLSFMEKRLRLARGLLKPDGVLVVTIDENEGSHLGVLLEGLFPEAFRQMVTICINPSGASGGDGLSRVDEYAYFCFFGGAQPVETADDMLVSAADADVVHTNAEGVRWEWLMRGGNAWYRDSRPNMCYPILLNEEGTRIVKAGGPYTGPEGEQPERVEGYRAAWPIRKDGKLGIWRVEGERLNALAEQGYAYVSRRDAARGTWTIKYLMSGVIESIEAGLIEVLGREPETGRVSVRAAARKGKRAKTMWYRGRHTAGGAGGTALLNALLGERNVFPFPKSVYTIRDLIEVAIGNREDALILDFFAGSGTTLHATLMLNAADGGARRCVLATNNEVDEKLAKKLEDEGIYPRDREYERHGIFEAATRPRVEAAITGRRSDGSPVPGSYLDGRAYADGFQENCEFFALDYLSSDRIELGLEHEALHPVYWLAAGARGKRPERVDAEQSFALVPGCGYAVLFDPTGLASLNEALAGAPEGEHVFVLTHSHQAFAQIVTALGRERIAHMVPADYLRWFRAAARLPL